MMIEAYSTGFKTTGILPISTQGSDRIKVNAKQFLTKE